MSTDGLIAVTGATGGLGGRVARRLAGRGVAQRLVVRDAARAPELEGAEVVVVKGTYDEAASEVGRGAPEAAFHRAVHTEDFTYRRPCACSYASLGEVAARGR